MAYRGRVSNGVIVFDGPLPLKEGTVVNVEPASASAPAARPGSREALLSFRDRWVGPPGELDRLMAEVQEMREADPMPAGGDE